MKTHSKRKPDSDHQIAVFSTCPRCGERSFESLHSYGHCCNCLYFEDYAQETVGFDAAILKRAEAKLTKPKKNKDAEENLYAKAL